MGMAVDWRHASEERLIRAMTDAIGGAMFMCQALDETRIPALVEQALESKGV